MLDLYVDADACPVKDEIYRVARRYRLAVILVANSWMGMPDDPAFRLVVVRKGENLADDWIVEHAGPDDIVITGDIPLAARCIDKGARVLGLRGRPFTEENVGDALATRNLLKDLRDAGTQTRGPEPFARKDRSAFLQGLDRMIQDVRRGA